MSLPVVLRPEASRDAQEARDYLEGQQTGLGQALLDRLNETLAAIAAMPEMYGGTCARRGCGASPMWFTTESTPTVSRCSR